METKLLADGNKIYLDNRKLFIESDNNSKITISDIPGLLQYLHAEIVGNKISDIYDRPHEAKKLLEKWEKDVWKINQVVAISESSDGIFVKFENNGAAKSACEFFESNGWETVFGGCRAQMFQDNIR